MEETFLEMSNELTTNKDYDSDEIVYLHVPYDKKEYVKVLGGRWCNDHKQWYCKRGFKILVEEFSEPIIKPQKIYLNIPYDKKDEFKKYNGRWCQDHKQWYIYDNNKDINYLLEIYN